MPTIGGSTETIPGIFWDKGGAALNVCHPEFGARRDAVTDDAPAIQAALDAAGTGANPTGAVVVLPPGEYYCASSLRIRRTVTLRGSGGSGEYPATVLRFADGVSGIVVERSNTSSDGGRGDWCSIESLYLTTKGKTSPDAHGILAYARFTTSEVYIARFGGHGYCIRGGSGKGPGGVSTNANNFHIYGGRSSSNAGHGFYATGSDANAGKIWGLDATANGGWGICDDSFLGNYFFGVHAASNGTRSQVHYAGNRYYLNAKAADSAGAATVPGTDANVWVLAGPGGATSTYPDWSATGDYIAGGAFRLSLATNQGGCILCYTEQSQPPCFIKAPAMWIGGVNGAGFTADSDGHRILGTTSGAVVEGGAVTYNGSGTRFQPSPANFSGAAFVAGDMRFSAGGYQTNVYKNWMEWQSATNMPGFGMALQGATVFGRTETVARGAIIARAGLWRQDMGTYSEARREELGTAAPTSGEWAAGDRILNRSPSATKAISHWLCVGGGTPGTWRAVGTGSGTTAQRPATLVAADAGYTYWDTTLSKLVYWNGLAWVG